MDLIKSLVDYLKSNKEVNKKASPEGFCPNCWGRQEYSGNFYEAVKNHGLDANTKQPEIGWIKDYAEKNLKGIRMETKNESVVCPSCKISYRKKD